MVVAIKRIIMNYRVNNTRWCVLRWPNPSMAQGAKMSTEAFEDFYFKACLADYPKMQRAAQALVDLMNNTDKVRLVAQDTDITFSIKGIPAVPCCGNMNIPDGEVSIQRRCRGVSKASSIIIPKLRHFYRV